MSLIPVLLLTWHKLSFLWTLIVRKQRPRGIREKSSQFIQNVIGKLLAGFVIVLYICYLYNFFSPFCSLMAPLCRNFFGFECMIHSLNEPVASCLAYCLPYQKTIHTIRLQEYPKVDRVLYLLPSPPL